MTDPTPPIDPFATFKPIASDAGLPLPILAVGNIGSDHLHVETITTFAAEAFTNDGTDHQHAVIIELEGRFNRTTTTGTAKAILSVDAATTLLETLFHTLQAHFDQAEKP